MTTFFVLIIVGVLLLAAGLVALFRHSARRSNIGRPMWRKSTVKTPGELDAHVWIPLQPDSGTTTGKFIRLTEDNYLSALRAARENEQDAPPLWE